MSAQDETLLVEHALYNSIHIFVVFRRRKCSREIVESLVVMSIAKNVQTQPNFIASSKHHGGTSNTAKEYIFQTGHPIRIE